MLKSVQSSIIPSTTSFVQITHYTQLKPFASKLVALTTPPAHYTVSKAVMKNQHME